jgi:Legionella pneumophila major outer membrane protein precursor
MSFRNLLIVGLLGCVAWQSAYSQDVEPWSARDGEPAAAGPMTAAAESAPPSKPDFNESEGAVASPDAIFAAPPESVSISRNSDLEQIVHRAIQPAPNGGNCVGPACAETNACASPNGCAPPMTNPAAEWRDRRQTRMTTLFGGPPLTNAAAECCDPCLLRHRHGIFADYLFLSATGIDMPYALPVDGLGPVNVLQGPAAVADTKYDSGFRVGGIVALDDCTSIMATYWHYRSDSQDERLLSGGGAPFLLAQMTDPGTMNVAADSLLARARYDVDFDMVDLVLRRALYRSQTSMFNAVAGVRWARLSQNLQAEYSILGQTFVNSDVDFSGVGPRIGLEGEYVSCSGFLVYANTHANFLVGTFNADYLQSNIFTGSQSFTSLDDTRVVTQLELELGLGWQSKCGTFRFTVGYYIAGWYNCITNPVWIRGVQDRRLENLHDDIGFNGLTARAMIQF